MSSATAAEPRVVDSSVIVASYIPEEINHLRGLEYRNGLDRGDYLFHLPMLVVVEVASAARRRLSNWQQAIDDWQRNLVRWERDGQVVLYPLNRVRMERSISAAQRRRPRGADSVVASLDEELAEELNLPLRTFDGELLERGPRATP